MCSIEEDVPTPLCNNVADGLDGKGKQRHRSPQRDHFVAYQWGDFAEEVKVNFQFDRVKRDIYNLQTTYPGWPIDRVTAARTASCISCGEEQASRTAFA